MGSSASDHDSCSLTRKLSVLSGHSSSFEDEVFVRRASVDDRSEKRLDQGWTARKSTFASFGSSTLESSRDDDVDGNGQGRKRKTDDSILYVYYYTLFTPINNNNYMKIKIHQYAGNIKMH